MDSEQDDFQVTETILDVLDADCWRAVLDLLDIEQVVRSERVSRGWQRVVLRYLQGDAHRLLASDLQALEALATTKYRQLKTIVFYSCPDLDEYFLCRLIINNSPEHLVIHGALVTGHFLSNLKSRALKSLIIHDCSSFNVKHVLSASGYLSELTRLDLCQLQQNFSQVPELIERMPNLEHLSLNHYYKTSSHGFNKFLGRLVCLQRLTLMFNANVGNGELAAIGRACTQLRSLNINHCYEVTGHALAAFCRAQPALRELFLAFNSDATDEDLAACISACHGLTLLDVTGCPRVTPRLVALAAAATRPRAHRLTLRANCTAITPERLAPASRDACSGLTLDLDPSPGMGDEGIYHYLDAHESYRYSEFQGNKNYLGCTFDAYDPEEWVD